MPISASQKTRMLAMVAALRGEIDALVVDDVVPIPPVGSSGLWTRHNSAYFGGRKFLTVGVDAAGKPGSPPVAGAPYYSQPVASTVEGRVLWGKDLEHHKLIDGFGLQWGGLFGFEDTSIPGSFYPIEAVSVDWINLDINKSIDMTAIKVQGKFGHVMCPQVLPASGNYRIRVWFWMWPNLTGARQFMGYWQCDYHFGRMVTNLAWVGEGSSVRRGIVYEEAWWDENQGWVGGGSSQQVPWVAGAPVVVTVNYAGTAAFGENAGTLWNYQRPGYGVGLGNVVLP